MAILANAKAHSEPLFPTDQARITRLLIDRLPLLLGILGLGFELLLLPGC